MTSTRYTPAADRFEEFKQAIFEPAKEMFFAAHRDGLLQKSRATLLPEIGTNPRSSLTKPELVERILGQRWMKTDEQATWEELRRALVREREVLDRIDDSVKDLETAKTMLADAVAEGKVYEITEGATRVRQAAIIEEIFERVAALSDPSLKEPVEALRQVIEEQTVRALDDLEDRAQDLFPAQVRARWIRRVTYLVEQ